MSTTSPLFTFLHKIALITDPDKSFLSFGAKIIPLNTMINIQKGGTIFYLLILMWYFNNYSLGAYVYLGLHGTYGIVWLIKDFTLPDKTFRKKVSLPVALLIAIVLILYWSIGYIMISGISNQQQPTPLRIFFAFFIFSIGLMLMICTDIQKNLTLTYKKGLISNYFLSINRNTNYFGEMLLYYSFALITNHWFAYALLILTWVSLFSCRIILKEYSLMQKEGWDKYKSNTYILLFKFTSNHFINVCIYIIIFICIMLISIYA